MRMTLTNEEITELLDVQEGEATETITADFIDACFSVRRDGCLVVSTFHENRFTGTPDEWNLLVSCVEDNITDDDVIDSVQAARDYETAKGMR